MVPVLLSLLIGGSPSVDLVKLLNDAKKCAAQRVDPNTIECSFRLGKSLVITIAGVGEDLASVSFDKSDSSGDYFAKYQVAVGCILVTTGYDQPLVVPAFINPKTAVVYGSWEACQASTRRSHR